MSQRQNYDFNGDLDHDWAEYNQSFKGMVGMLPSSKVHHSSTGNVLTRKKLMNRRKTLSHEARRSQHVRDMEMKAEKELRQIEVSEVDDEHAQRKQLEMIKQMPTSIQVKRLLKKKLLNIKVEALTGCSAIKESRRQCLIRHRARLHDIGIRLTLWGGSFRRIEGHFGSGVLSYFLFLKWLLILNILLFLLTFGFIILPRVTLSGKDVPRNSWIAGNISEYRLNTSDTCTRIYDNSVNVSNKFTDVAVDFLQGTGFMEDTVMMYGYYDNTEYFMFQLGDYRAHYNLPMGYLLTVIGCLLLSLMFMIGYTSSTFKKNVLNDQEDSFYQYCNKVFAGWDFVMNEEDSAALKKKSLFFEIKSDLEEMRDHERREQRTTSGQCRLFWVRLLINLFVLAVLGGSGAAIIFVSKFEVEYSNTAEFNELNSFVQLLVEFLPSLTITVLNFIVPFIFIKIVVPEDYYPHISLRITLIRTVFLRLASLGLLVGTIYIQLNCADAELTCNTCSSIYCWETHMGQQLYKLVIMDFLVVFLVTLIVEPLRKVIVTRCKGKLCKLLGQAKFEIPKQVLDLVYSQTLCWLGTLFCPIIPAMCVIKFFLFFYMKKLSVLWSCDPEDRPYRASKTNTFFMVLLIVAFLLVCFPIGFVIVKQPPSRGCGPFRIYESMWDIVGITIDNWPADLQTAITFITSHYVAVPLFIITLLALYYWWAVASANKEMVMMMKEQLLMESKDKQFLLAKMNEMSGNKGPSRVSQPAAQPTITETITEETEVSPSRSSRQSAARQVSPQHSEPSRTSASDIAVDRQYMNSPPGVVQEW